VCIGKVLLVVGYLVNIGSGRDDRYFINYEDIQLFGVLVSAAILNFVRCLIVKECKLKRHDFAGRLIERTPSC